MDNNPFKPSSYENRNAQVVVDFPDYDFYPSNNTYNQKPSSSSGFDGATTSATPPNFGFGEDQPGGSQQAAEDPATNKSILSHPLWTWKFWQSFFDVDTSEVLRRIFFSFAPWPRYLKSESVDVFIGAKPDLYGPFWICSTLVFVIAVLGNIASYFQNLGACLNWDYDYHKVTAAAISIFLYVWVLPVGIWTFLWWRGTHGTLKLSGALCLYGYSMFLYIPVSFLWLINILWLQWIFALTAATLSGFILAYIFWNHLHFNHAKLAVMIALVVFVLHLGLGFGFVTYFFHYPPHAACPSSNSTETYHSTTHLDILNITSAAQTEIFHTTNLTITPSTLSTTVTVSSSTNGTSLLVVNVGTTSTLPTTKSSIAGSSIGTDTTTEAVKTTASSSINPTNITAGMITISTKQTTVTKSV